MPRPEELVDRMGHAQFITTLDMTKGFYQVPMNPNDSEKTALVTPLGKFEFQRMPFSLKNSPATFQRGVGAILSQQFDNGARPIAFFSKKLNPVQARYTATEKECLAVILALQHFVVYLLGKRFILQIDHKALTKLRTINNDNPRL